MLTPQQRVSCRRHRHDTNCIRATTVTSTKLVRKLSSAVQQHRAGNVPAALQLYAEVLQTDPHNADAWHLSGLAAHQSGNSDQAESLIRHALQLAPAHCEFKANLASVFLNAKRWEEAQALCQEILAVNPSHAAALNHLGTALRGQRKLRAALAAFEKAVQLQPDAETLCNLGVALLDLADLDQALHVLLQARELAPNQSQLLLNLGSVYRQLKQPEAAMQMLLRAESLAPSSCEVQINKAKLQMEIGQIQEAIGSCQKAICIDSARPSAVSALGMALQQLGHWEQALEAHRLAADLDRENHSYHSSYLYAVTLCPLLSPQEVTARHATWGRNLESRITPLPDPRFANGDQKTSISEAEFQRRLRIGYVSPDFRSHATMRFLMPLLQAHDAAQVELFFYSETVKTDQVTQQVQQLATGWRPTRELSDIEMAQRIQQDRIDILVDLAGHTVDNRLPVFAFQPAPIQVSFLGYPTTTGLSRIQYFLVDAVRLPTDQRDQLVETPVLMPHGACCYVAKETLEITDPPCLQTGHVTLGSTHRPEKISPQTWQLWTAVMNAVPAARLLLFRDAFAVPATRTQLLQAASAAGIDSQRIDFGWELPTEYLSLYSQIDILLDVFPWGSGTIAYDAMWMGVPIPTLPGDRIGCRATASLLHHCGFPELIADNADDYVRLVSTLASQPQRLQQLRHSIRPAMQATVSHPSQFARDVEAAFRTMWHQYLATAKSGQETSV